MNFKNRFISLLLIFSSSAYGGDFDLTPSVEKAYFEIFKFKIKTGENLLLKERKDNPFRVYLENYIDLIELLNADDEEYYEKIKYKEDDRLELIESLDKKSPYNRFLRAEIK